MLADDYDRIESYINNLHPQNHPDLYQTIEKIIRCALPLWNITLSSWPPGPKRIPFDTVKYGEVPEEALPANPEQNETQDQFEERRLRVELQLKEDALIFPEPTSEVPGELRITQDLQEQFSNTGLQVIVKLANIHLTAEKPCYEGETWHVEGLLVCPCQGCLS